MRTRSQVSGRCLLLPLTGDAARKSVSACKFLFFQEEISWWKNNMFNKSKQVALVEVGSSLVPSRPPRLARADKTPKIEEATALSKGL